MRRDQNKDRKYIALAVKDDEVLGFGRWTNIQWSKDYVYVASLHDGRQDAYNKFRSMFNGFWYNQGCHSYRDDKTGLNKKEVKGKKTFFRRLCSNPCSKYHFHSGRSYLETAWQELKHLVFHTKSTKLLLKLGYEIKFFRLGSKHCPVETEKISGGTRVVMEFTKKDNFWEIWKNKQ